MDVVRSKEELRAASKAWRRAGDRIGFIPTMGALHEGHASLIRRSHSECARTVVSVFVNPTQFGQGEDYASYPRTLDADRALCEGAGADLLFAPDVEEMYGRAGAIEPSTLVRLESLEGILCGRSRPDHFRGVLTVVTKLLHIVQPTDAYFGRKDYQQFILVRRMSQDLDFPVRVQGCATVREPDGLAMSSRNRHLAPEDRAKALTLVEGLRAASAAFRSGVRNAQELVAQLRGPMGKSRNVEPEYAQIVHPETLQPVSVAEAVTVALVAARIAGKVRLIDNATVGEGVV
ncbi:MAG: pantoate--beta-alanine ligase [Planctomycetes bacterium]|nr:pantoate--beta-alanine ligase [Planctomycetota bacterium]